MFSKTINQYKHFINNDFGHGSFLIGTFFLGSALPLSIIFYLISIFVSVKRQLFYLFKDKLNKFLLIISGLMIFSSLNSTLELNGNNFFDSWISLFNWLPLFFLFICSKTYLNNAKKRIIFSKFLIAGTIPILTSCILQTWFLPC